MDTNTIVTLIGSVGFPIIMCLLMYKMQTQTMEELKTSIDNNSLVLQQLVDNMEDRTK